MTSITEDNVTRFPGRRDRALEVLVQLRVAIGDVRRALPAEELAAKLKIDAQQVAALYRDDEESAGLVETMEAAGRLLDVFRDLEGRARSAADAASALIFGLAATNDEPPVS